MARMTQKDRIMQYLADFKSITSYEAYEQLGITQLSARLKELHEQRGVNFKKERIYKLNRYGQKCRFDKYMLAEEKNS
jgi:hypothetical protein